MLAHGHLGDAVAVSQKKHILCDGKHQPLTAVFSPTQDQESPYQPVVSESAQLNDPKSTKAIIPAMLTGDKGCRAQWIDDWLLKWQIKQVMPCESTEDRQRQTVEFDKASSRRRCIFKQLIGWLKACHCVAKRYEKLTLNYLSMVGCTE